MPEARHVGIGDYDVERIVIPRDAGEGRFAIMRAGQLVGGPLKNKAHRLSDRWLIVDAQNFE